MANPSIRNVAGYQEMVNDLTSGTSSAVAFHVALADPHVQYQKESEKGVAGGYASLDGSTTIPIAQIPSTVERTTAKNQAGGYAGLSTAGADLMVPKAAGTGIRVDSTGTPTFGWKDLLGDIKPDPGAAGPTSTNWQGNIVQFRFTVGDGVTNNFHIPHDYVPNTDIYVHAHWSVASSAIAGGAVTWGLEFSYAKGHQQAQFSTPATKDLVATASTLAYTHQLHETQISATVPSTSAIDRALLEPDGVLMLRTSLAANSLAVTSGSTPPPFLHYIDIHYQSNGVPTKQKAPDFYT